MSRGDDRRDRRRRRQASGEDRRADRRRGRAGKHTGGTDHNTRTCPACRRSIPYLDPVQDPPSECGECGYLWDCPECGREFDSEDRDEGGRPPAVCPTCDAAIDGGYEADDDSEEVETWNDM